MATALVAVAVLVNAIKGIQLAVSGMMWPYWTLSYRHGFVRRGLVGTLMLAMTPGLRDDERRSFAMQLHVIGWVAIGAILVHEAMAMSRRANARTRRLVFLATAAILLSQFIPTMGAVAGYLDLYIMLIALVSARFAREQRWIAASTLGAIGPFIHDAFVFLWLPIVACALFDLRSSKWRVREIGRPLGWIALPVLTEIAALTFHSPGALARCFNELPPGTPDIRVFEMPLGWMLERMSQAYGENFPNFLLAVTYYGAPAAVAVACAIRLLPHTKPLSGIAIAYVALLPCSILFVAWDLSRFLVWMYFGAFVVLCHVVPREAEREAPEGPVGSDTPRGWEAALLVALVLVAVGGPTTYSYFDRTFVEYRIGPAFLARTPGARLSMAFANLYDRRLQVRSFSSENGCKLDTPPSSTDGDCRRDMRRGTVVQTPPLELARGRYIARARIEPLGCPTATGRLSVQSHWRLAAPDPPPIAFDAHAASEVKTELIVVDEAAAMASLRVAVEGTDGCFRLTALDVARE